MEEIGYFVQLVNSVYSSDPPPNFQELENNLNELINCLPFAYQVFFETQLSDICYYLSLITIIRSGIPQLNSLTNEQQSNLINLLLQRSESIDYYNSTPLQKKCIEALSNIILYQNDMLPPILQGRSINFQAFLLIYLIEVFWSNECYLVLASDQMKALLLEACLQVLQGFQTNITPLFFELLSQTFSCSPSYLILTNYFPAFQITADVNLMKSMANCLLSIHPSEHLEEDPQLLQLYIVICPLIFNLVHFFFECNEIETGNTLLDHYITLIFPFLFKSSNHIQFYNDFLSFIYQYGNALVIKRNQEYQAIAQEHTFSDQALTDFTTFTEIIKKLIDALEKAPVYDPFALGFVSIFALCCDFLTFEWEYSISISIESLWKNLTNPLLQYCAERMRQGNITSGFIYLTALSHQPELYDHLFQFLFQHPENICHPSWLFFIKIAITYFPQYCISILQYIQDQIVFDDISLLCFIRTLFTSFSKTKKQALEGGVESFPNEESYQFIVQLPNAILTVIYSQINNLVIYLQQSQFETFFSSPQNPFPIKSSFESIPYAINLFISISNAIEATPDWDPNIINQTIANFLLTLARYLTEFSISHFERDPDIVSPLMEEIFSCFSNLEISSFDPNFNITLFPALLEQLSPILSVPDSNIQSQLSSFISLWSNNQPPIESEALIQITQHCLQWINYIISQCPVSGHFDIIAHFGLMSDEIQHFFQTFEIENAYNMVKESSNDYNMINDFIAMIGKACVCISILKQTLPNFWGFADSFLVFIFNAISLSFCETPEIFDTTLKTVITLFSLPPSIMDDLSSIHEELEVEEVIPIKAVEYIYNLFVDIVMSSKNENITFVIIRFIQAILLKFYSDQLDSIRLYTFQNLSRMYNVEGEPLQLLFRVIFGEDVNNLDPHDRSIIISNFIAWINANYSDL